MINSNRKRNIKYQEEELTASSNNQVSYTLHYTKIS